MFESILLICGAFALGSIPTGYVIGRLAGGIDIRDFGSGNVGASNVAAHIGARTGYAVGVFDCVVKGILPVLIGRAMGMELWIQGAVGIAAIAGHNWSPLLRFTGGRGVATGIGVAVGIGMHWEVLIIGLVVFTIGMLFTRDTGLWTFIGLLALPPLGMLIGQPPVEITVTAVCIGLALLAKRLTANWERPRAEYGVAWTLIYRLVWDRDVPRGVEWTERRPSRG